MSKPNEIFAKRILKISGVNNFILVKEDGLILSHNIESDDPDMLSSIIILCGLGSDTIKSALGFTHFNYFMITREKKETLFVFPVENYFLGVFTSEIDYSSEESDDNRIKFVNKIAQFVETITKKKGRTR